MNWMNDEGSCFYRTVESHSSAPTERARFFAFVDDAVLLFKIKTSASALAAAHCCAHTLLHTHCCAHRAAHTGLLLLIIKHKKRKYVYKKARRHFCTVHKFSFSLSSVTVCVCWWMPAPSGHRVRSWSGGRSSEGDGSSFWPGLLLSASFVRHWGVSRWNYGDVWVFLNSEDKTFQGHSHETANASPLHHQLCSPLHQQHKVQINTHSDLKHF